MKIEEVEILLVFLIVAIQLYVFIRTFMQIRVFRNIIPDVNSLFITKIFVPTEDVQRLTPKQILEKVDFYKKNKIIISDDQEDNYIEKSEITIIKSEINNNKIFDRILYSVNNYLIRNRGAASDFNLIKDIVERNTDAVEEDINTSTGVPLYLGLMGTMIGIVIALFNMPNLSIELGSAQTGQALDEGISMLIGGVKIAMIASFAGLLLTIINSGWVFKGSRSFSEARKNEFYTFIQIELLPLINQGLASTLQSLQRNLLKFNNEFSTNLKGLTGIFDSSRKAIKEQKELIDTLDKAKVSDMTRYNVAVLKQLDISVGQFEKFNAYLINVTQFVENSQLIVSRTNELLARTDNFKNIADNLENKLNQSQLLIEFISAHFKKLDEHKEFTNMAVADVGHSISETFKQLKEHIHNSSEAVKRFTVDETELLKTALSESKSNLSNLEYLETLKIDVSQFKNASSRQGERLKQSIDDLNKNMARTIAILEQIEKQKTSKRSNGFTKSIKNLFKSK